MPNIMKSKLIDAERFERKMIDKLLPILTCLNTPKTSRKQIFRPQSDCEKAVVQFFDDLSEMFFSDDESHVNARRAVRNQRNVDVGDG